MSKGKATVSFDLAMRLCPSIGNRRTAREKNSNERTIPNNDRNSRCDWNDNAGWQFWRPTATVKPFLRVERKATLIVVQTRYDSDRASNSGSGRYYRDSNYQQQEYGENNYENNTGRRSTNYPARNGHRGRRGYGSTGNSYRGGTQSDAGTGGEHQFDFFRSSDVFFADEASECGDQRDVSNSNANRKHRDWSTQVDSEQQQETGYSTDSMIPSENSSRGNRNRRGDGRGWKRGRPPLPTRPGGICIFSSGDSHFRFLPTPRRMTIE